MKKYTPFLTVGLLLGSALVVNAQTNWMAQDLSHSWGGVNDVTRMDSLFVAVGDSVLTSRDGALWAARDAGIRDSLQVEWQMQSVAWTGKLLVAVGRYYDKTSSAKRGFIITSPDGATWTKRDAEIRSHLYSVIWSGDQLVAIGDSGSICTSPDGIAWTTRNSGTTKWLFDVAWTGSQFVLVGDGTILTSPDGIAWTSRTPDTTKVLTSVAWTGKRLVVVGWDGAKLYSEDGITWFDRTVKPDISTIRTNFYSLAWTGAKLVTVGVTSYGSRGEAFIATTEDGTTLSWGNVNSVIPATKWSPASVALCGDQLILVGMRTILTSPDGYNWNNRSLESYWNLRAVVSTGSQYVAVGDNGTIRTSPDGVRWTSRNSGTTANLVSVAWTGAKLVAVGKSGTILLSTDGIAWTPSNYPKTTQPASLESVAWNGSLLVAVAHRILTSPDGVTWTFRDSSVSGYHHSVTWTGTQFVAVGDSISFSPDGISWTHRRSAGLDTLSSVIWTGTGYAGVGRYGAFGTSPDGIAWNIISLKVGLSRLNAVAWSGASFVVGGEYGTLYTSPDGINWTNIGMTSSSENTYLSATWTGGRFFITNTFGGISSSTQTPVNIGPNKHGKPVKAPIMRVVGGAILVSEPSASQGIPARMTAYKVNGEKSEPRASYHRRSP